MTKFTFEETLVEVWRQALVENARTVELGAGQFSVKKTAKRGLRQVDSTFEGNGIRGVQQNPATKSQWATLARSESDAVSEQRMVRRKGSRWQSCF